MLTGLTFFADLQFEFGFATWLPYFLLAVPVSALYSRRLFLGAVGGWTLLIAAKVWAHLPSHDVSTDLFNRTFGIVGLWIAAYLLYQHRELGRLRNEDEQRVRTMLHGALDAVITIDAQSIITTWNPQAEQTFGYTPEEALGAQLPDLIIPASFREAHLKGVERFVTKGDGPILNRRIEVTAVHKNGREFPIELTVMPLRMKRSLNFCAFARDITERKQLESTLRRAQESAEGASQAKSDFLANISHEIRTPLNAICGTTDLLLTTTLTLPQRRYAEMCAKASHTLLGLVTELLDFSRIEAGQTRLEQAPYDVRQLIDRTTQLLFHRAEEKGLALTFHLDPDVPPWLEGDAFRLHQILLNLISNALKFTEQGHVTVRCSLTYAGPEPSRIRFSVMDSGIGIPADQLDRIFDRFTQVNSASSRQHGGVGLGLAICARLVGLMGGRIWAESLAELGSTFIVDLPLTIATAPERLHEQTCATPSSLAPVPLAPSVPAASRYHVLLAEDSQESQELMRFYFQDLPYRVTIVPDGEQAVARFQANRFDIVLIDLQMPGMDGFTATRLIRAWESAHQRPPTPIVALTANAFREAEERCLAAGCTGFLTKPISKRQLLDALATYLCSMPQAHSRPKDLGKGLEVADRIAREILERRPRFLQHRRKDLGAMQEALARQDYEAIRTMGHRIKGVAGSYGFPDIGAVGQRLEESARLRDHIAIQGEIAQLAAILHQLDRAA